MTHTPPAAIHPICCATVREMMGMAAAGLGDDLLLANESLDLTRLTPIIETGGARGMRTLDSDLLALFFQGTVSEEEVFNYCQNPEAMRERMRGGAAAR